MSTEQPETSLDKDSGRAECRACLQKMDSEELFNLFQAWTSSWEGMKSTIAEDLSTLADIQLQETDKHSSLICSSCCTCLWNACKFKLLVQENDKILRQRYAQTDTQVPVEKEWPLPIQVEKTVTGLYNNSLEVEIKQEILSDDENMANGEEGFTTTNCEDMIKIEPEEIAEPVTSHSPSLGITHMNGQDSLQEDYLHNYIKEEPLSDTEDGESTTDLPMECLLCARAFNSVSGLKAHVIAQHSYQTVERRAGDASPHRSQNNKYVCGTCRRTFVTSTDLMVHETCHNKHICYGCSAKFDTFGQLTRHRRRCKALSSPGLKRLKTLDDVKRPQQDNVSVAELKIEINNVTTLADSKDILSCIQCNEVFSDSYYMKIHQEVHHSKEETVEMKNGSIPMEMEALESIFTEQT